MTRTRSGYYGWPSREAKIEHNKEYYKRKRAKILATQSCMTCGSNENLGIVSMKGEGLVRCAECKKLLRNKGVEEIHNATRYRQGCRCEICRNAKRADDKRYHDRKKLKQDASIKVSKRMIDAKPETIG